MLQFASSVKKIRSRASVILLPVSLWLGHSFLAARLEVIQNRGISFGVNLPMTKIFLAIFLAILLGQVVKSFKWSIYLVFIGGLVNFTDRLLVGFVRDYFKVIFFYNNLADWVIFVGVTLYIFGFFYGKNRHSL